GAAAAAEAGRAVHGAEAGADEHRAGEADGGPTDGDAAELAGVAAEPGRGGAAGLPGAHPAGLPAAARPAAGDGPSAGEGADGPGRADARRQGLPRLPAQGAGNGADGPVDRGDAGVRDGAGAAPEGQGVRRGAEVADGESPAVTAGRSGGAAGRRQGRGA